MADALEPVYLICGSDRPKVLRAVARLRARFGDESEDVLPAGASPADVVAAVQQLGLFADDRLVTVHDVDGWKKDDLRPLADYLRAPVDGTVIALVAAGLRKDAAIAKLIDGPGLLRFDLPTGDALRRHVADEARRLGARFEPDALRLLVELVGEDATALVNEVDKLATYAAGEPIDAELVDRLAFRSAGAVPFALTNALSSRDRRAAFRAAMRALDDGDKPHALLPQVANHVGLLGRACRERDGGGSAATLARATGLHEFRARLAFEAAARWSAREAAIGVCRLAEADHAMKGGRRISPELALEFALAEII